MLVPWIELNRRQLGTSQCAKGEERKLQGLAEDYLWESTETAFQAYGEPLETVNLFNYLGRFMTAGDDKFTAVVGLNDN